LAAGLRPNSLRCSTNPPDPSAFMEMAPGKGGEGRGKEREGKARGCREDWGGKGRE